MQPAELTPGQRVALAGYTTLLRLLTPAYLLRLWSRGRAEPLYRHAIGERFGRYRDPPVSGTLWLHAVSLGETRAAAALVDALRARRPGLRLVLTHGTATGREAGRELLRDGDRQAWLPVDTPGAVNAFLDHFRPDLGVLMETEVWPRLLLEAARRGLPMVLANARLSERSARRGRRTAALMRPAAERIALALAQSPSDAERLRAAGGQRVIVSGNLKFDMAPDAALLARGRAWRQALGRPVVLAASTREGEEMPLLRAWAAQREAHAARPLLVVVPRHPQRFDEAAAVVAGAGLTLARRSAWGDAPSAESLQADAWLGDSLGEMPLYYAMADVALLGGSFAPLGGQNLIEAAACGCPLLMGPSTFNFAEAAALALAAGAARRVADVDRAVAAALSLVDDVVGLAAMGQVATAFAAQHRGAALRMADAITALLDARTQARG